MGGIFTSFLLFWLWLNQPGSCATSVRKSGYEERLLGITADLRLQQVTLQSEYSDLRGKVKATLDRMESTLDYLQNTRKDLTEDLADKFEDATVKLTKSQNTPIVVFKASGVTKLSPVTGDILVFPNVMLDSGDNYDPSTGIFTAPEDGLYLFTTYLCSHVKKWIVTSIMVEKTEVGRSLSFGSSVSTCNTGDALAMVKAGMQVCVRTHSSHGSLYSNIHRLITFTGVLLHKSN